MADLFGSAPLPATRRTDPDTSHEAAESQADSVASIREWVLSVALEKGTAGFIDDDLKRARADAPESSFRKRRTELAQENWLVDSGRRRPNRQGNREIVWVHRDFAASPPELKHRMEPPKRDELKALGRKQAADLAGFAEDMRKEGRMMFSNALREIAETLAALAR